MAWNLDAWPRMPLDSDDLRLPIKLDSTTNGEYLPLALPPGVAHAKRVALERADLAARRLGLTRRQFLRTSAASATVLLALNETGCGGGRYALNKEQSVDPEAADAVLSGDEFVFDVQTHHVATERSWWDTQPLDMGTYLSKLPAAECGAPHWSACFSRDAYLKEVFLDSDTDMAVLSALWGTAPMNPLLVEEMAATRARIEAMEGAPRFRIHGPVRPKSDPRAQTRDHMQQMAEELSVSAWKLYPVWSSDGQGYRLDDPDTGAWVLQHGVDLGVPLFAIHKGLPLPGAANAFTSPIDVGPAARMFPQATLLIYHSGYDPQKRVGPYDPNAETGVDALIRGLEENGIGKDGNVYAELGSVWREVMKSPDQAAHLLGKLLVHLGEDRILWGTDAIWYGSPQDQIQAFRAFEITPEYRDRFGYPALTPEIKAKILGLNAARVYGVDVDEIKRGQRWDPVSRAQAEYRNNPQPSFRTYGPRTRRELISLLRAEADM